MSGLNHVQSEFPLNVQNESSTRFSRFRRKVFRFLIAGGIATGCQYLVLVAFVELLSINAVIASAVGFTIGGVVNYILNYVYTFQSELPHLVAFPRFVVTAIIGLSINTGSMYVLVEIAGLFYFLSQLIATGLTLLWNFIIHNFWSFREGSISAHDDQCQD